MQIRYYMDESSGEPHIRRHGLREEEIEEAMARPLEDRRSREDARVMIGRTKGGRIVRIVYVPEPHLDAAFVITA